MSRDDGFIYVYVCVCVCVCADAVLFGKETDAIRSICANGEATE